MYIYKAASPHFLSRPLFVGALISEEHSGEVEDEEERLKEKKEEMSGRGKRKDDEEQASEGDAPPKKTFKKDSNETDESEIVVCEISKNRRVMVRNWQGKIVVDIREFYVKDGKQMPGKKGISLSLDQWTVLRNHVEEIDKAVNENSLGN